MGILDDPREETETTAAGLVICKGNPATEEFAQNQLPRDRQSLLAKEKKSLKKLSRTQLVELLRDSEEQLIRRYVAAIVLGYQVKDENWHGVALRGFTAVVNGKEHKLGAQPARQPAELGLGEGFRVQTSAMRHIASAKPVVVENRQSRRANRSRRS